jgi:hypothetical protein
MWAKWLHEPARAKQGRPLCWWHQLETSRRGELPFAHLFPKPPAERQRDLTEAQRLVAELIPSRVPEPDLEATVQAYVDTQTAPGWEPVEPWQIVGIGRLDPSEAADWGPDGLQVLEWFDRGELAVWPLAPLEEPDEERGLWQRLVARVRRALAPSPEMAGAEC